MTVRELLARIDSRELSEWAAYYELEPWGCDIEDWRAGMIASTIANVNRDPKKHRKQFQASDFIPDRVKPPVEEQTWEEQAKILEMWSAVMGGAK